MLFDTEMVSDGMHDASEYLRLIVHFDFAVMLIGRAEEETILAALEPSDNSLAVYEGEDYMAVAVVAAPLNYEQIIVKDIRLDHRVAGEARKEGVARPRREQVMQIESGTAVFLRR